MIRVLPAIIAFLLSPAIIFAQAISTTSSVGSFPIVEKGKATTILIDQSEPALIEIAAGLLARDIALLSDITPEIVTTPTGKTGIILGTIEQSGLIKSMVAAKKLSITGLQNQWEAYQISVVEKPLPGLDRALVIVGSDRRGAAYGAMELSRLMGVSPWYWWADVPVAKKAALYFSGKTILKDAPEVKYRGIFLNDEAPALSGWTKEKFGGFNSKFYVNVFELLIRLKANYLWPAMWGNAFNDDDSLNPVLADKWGIVMGTSHHEPMLRAQQEWKRFGKGPWDYNTNDSSLKAFWKKGIENMGNHESLITIAMRGDGDEPMSRETATNLLEKIVTDQRKIIAEVTGKPAEQTPQLWALYKEVQDYYDKGMRVPDDVTLLLCDDNWGNIRRLPNPADPPRKGGYGIYYHFDYVGGPRNYKWLNTNNLARVWEQMNLAYEYKARQIWIVNVGDLKPMELPISFFLDHAWNPEKFTASSAQAYYNTWAAEQFGKANASTIGTQLAQYSQYSAARKPELLDANTYSLNNYKEWDKVADRWSNLQTSAEKTAKSLPTNMQDAYFQLLLHPTKATSNLHRLYLAHAKNRKYAAEGNVLANAYADSVKYYYLQDSLITISYHQLNNGKWNHLMSQTHIGYRSWQEPRRNAMPPVTYLTADSAKNASSVADVATKTSTKTKGVFYEKDGYVSMQANHFQSQQKAGGIGWQIIPGIGREGDGVSTAPVNKWPKAGEPAPTLTYRFSSNSEGEATIVLYCSPTLDFLHQGGLKVAVSVDGATPIEVNVNGDELVGGAWNRWAGNNIITKKIKVELPAKKLHKLTLSMVSPGIVLQKIVVDFGGLKESYFGPEETLY